MIKTQHFINLAILLIVFVFLPSMSIAAQYEPALVLQFGKNDVSQLSLAVAANVFQTGIAAEVLLEKATTKAAEQERTSARGKGRGGSDDDCEKAVGDFIKSAGELKRKGSDQLHGFANCNAGSIFEGLASKCGAKTEIDTEDGHLLFKAGIFRIDLTDSRKGLPTIRVNRNNGERLWSIRCKND